MKSFLIIPVLLVLSCGAQTQDSLRKFEFGSTVATLYPAGMNDYYGNDRPGYELLNGIFFRYTKKRMGYRAFAAYSENTAWYGEFTRKDFIIGAGVQRTVFRRHNWFYIFADVAYRNLFSTGYEFADVPGTEVAYTNRSNGIDTYLGLGFRIRVFRNVFLTPEIGDYISTGFQYNSSTALSTGKVTNLSVVQTNIATFMRLHVTVRF